MPLVHIRTARAAKQKTFVMGYDPVGPTCHLGQYAALVKGFFAEEGLHVQGVAALDNQTAVAQGRPHRLWIKTDAGLSEADVGYGARTRCTQRRDLEDLPLGGTLEHE